MAAALHFYLCHKKTHFFLFFFLSKLTPFVGLRISEHTPGFTWACLVIEREFVRRTLNSRAVS